MARRPTIHDVARAAGLSPATVDRVLNGRESVRAETARRVAEAAQAIGYHAAPLIAQRMGEAAPLIRLGIVLQKERQSFYQAFRAELERAALRAPGVRLRLEFAFSTSQSPAEFVALMEGLASKVDLVTGTIVAHPEVTEAVIRLRDRRIPTVALLNDFAQGERLHYMGMNNLKVGRIAAHMIAESARKPGKIAVFVGGSRWHGHELRETGFRSYFREYAPDFTVLDTIVNLETRQLTYEATLDLLTRHPDLSGIYCAGGGMEGAIAALAESRGAGAVKLVVNELTPESRAALIARTVSMVIATPLPRLCDDLMVFVRDALALGQGAVGGQHFLQPDLYLPESV